MSKVRKIAFEEHYTAVGFKDYSKSFAQHIDPAVLADLAARLVDFDEVRLGEMDRGGIDYVILSQTGPGVQAEPDAAVALRRARENNDFLVQQVARHRRAMAPSPPYPCTIPGSPPPNWNAASGSWASRAR